LAMDFRITPKRRARVQALTNELDDIVLNSGGRFYFAKDSTLQPETVAAFLGDSALDRFRELKKQNDPENILQTNMWRRLFDN
jgi:decaprenylphospho-beta-D-ribofuranose 2-oxidase